MELSINRNTTELVKNNYFVLCGCSRFFYAVCALLHFPTRIYIVVTVMTDAFVMRCYILTILKLAHLLRKCILCIRLKSIRFNSISAKKRALRRYEKKIYGSRKSIAVAYKLLFDVTHSRFSPPIVTNIYFPKNFNQNAHFGLSFVDLHVSPPAGFHKFEQYFVAAVNIWLLSECNAVWMILIFYCSNFKHFQVVFRQQMQSMQLRFDSFRCLQLNNSEWAINIILNSDYEW